jgi:hypothetical protein
MITIKRVLLSICRIFLDLLFGCAVTIDIVSILQKIHVGILMGEDMRQRIVFFDSL